MTNFTEAPAPALLEVDRVTAGYGGPAVVRDVSLAIKEGRITALLGANGAGKTTLMRAICGMVRFTGSIVLGHELLSGQRTERIARLGIAHVPEGRGTFIDLSVEENLRVGCFARSTKEGAAEAMERIYGWLPRLAERRTQRAGSLSGGEQQMLAIGRALMAKPQVLLLDEPSFGLAPRVAAEIMRLLRRLQSETSMGILLVEQNIEIALGLADDAYVLRTGAVVASGPAAQLRGSHALRDAYLGAH
ncbi:ABC transporter ATP-binding protein [Variovorax sp.]|jgi:branched-chain amino acid transport system ATP-binding protein|uniref:ABC transporter ATP-binding protein n=1 Tax=Variovorax sp. TaxID=1871043 RepID=UPI00120A7D56|nr:ABC transporter ATP-binding protein [Variovorax sp.]TAJ58976.1 MAG: ABC transporter ATP-binding protein [Variovorax sp.]